MKKRKKFKEAQDLVIEYLYYGNCMCSYVVMYHL